MIIYRAIIEFLIILAIAQATVFNRLRSAREFSSIDTHAAVDISIVILLFFLLIANPRRLKYTLKNVSESPIIPIFCYYLLCCISAIWSIMPLYSGFRALQYLVLFWSVITIFSYYNPKSFYKAECKFLLFGLISVILNFGFHVRMYGFIMTQKQLHTNSYTASAAMVFMYVVGEHFGKRSAKKIRLKLIGIISFFFLIIGTSTASYIAVISGMIISFLIIRRPLISFYLVLIVAIGILVLSGDQFKSLLFYGKSQESINSLTGRATLWSDYWALFKQSPLLGQGFAIANRISSSHYATNAHNAVFSVLLSTGIIGFLFLLWGTFRLTKKCFICLSLKSNGSYGCVVAFATAIVNATSAAFIGDIWLNPSLVFAMLFGLQLIVIEKYDENDQIIELSSNHVTTTSVPIRS